MKTFNIAIISALSFLFGCVQPVDASKESKSLKKYVIFENQPIEQIEIGGGFEVTIVQGSENRVVFEMSPETFENTKHSLINGKLEISHKANLRSWPHASYKVIIEVQSFNELDFAGACAVSMSEFTIDRKVEIELSGASTLKMSKIISSHPLTIDASGASYFEAAELEVSDFDIDLSGASAAEIFKIKANGVNTEASGASHIGIAGEANSFEADASGASSINAKKLNVVTVRNISSSGASSIKVKK